MITDSHFFYTFMKILKMAKGQYNIVIGISGASGAIYAQKLMQILAHTKDLPSQVAVVITDTGEKVWQEELSEKFTCSFPVFDNTDFFAPFASGSSVPDVMIICPCSMGTLAKIATGAADNLLVRAADVVLKERKKLIIIPRETPLNLIHIQNMKIITQAGGIIMPASPPFYLKNQGSEIDMIIVNFIQRILKIAGLPHNAFQWGTE